MKAETSVIKIPEIGDIAKGTSYNFIGAISRSLFGTLLVFVFAKIMTANEMGLFFLGINIVTFISVVAVGGLSMGLRRFVSIAHGNDDADMAWSYFNTSIIILTPFVLIVCLVLFVYSEKISSDLFSKPGLASVLVSLIPFLVMFIFSQLFLSVTQAYKKMKYWVICLDIVNNFLRLPIALVLALLGYSLYSGVWSYVIAVLVTLIMSYYYFYKTIPARSKKNTVYKVREMLGFSIPVTLSAIMNSGNGLLSVLLVGFFLTASDVGLYTVAIKIVAIGAIVLTSFNTMFSPIISQLHNQGKEAELKMLFTCVTRWIFTISLPVYILIAWYADSIGAIFGEVYVSANLCVVVLCLGQIINALTGPSGNMLLMTGYAFINLWTNFIGLLLMLVLNILLIPDYGVAGSAIAVAASLSVVNLIRVYLAWKKLGLHPYEIGYFKPIVAAIILLVILVVMSPLEGELAGVMSLLLYVITSLTIYFVVVFALGLNQEDKYVLSKISNRLFGSK